MTMSGGNVDSINSGTLLIDNGATLTRSSGIVNSTVNLRKNFVGGALSPDAPAAIFTFPVGSASGYSPLTANVSGGSNGSLTVKAIGGLAPSTPALNPVGTLNRHWQLAETGALTADLTFSYLQGDVTGIEANYQLIRASAGAVPRRLANVAPCPGIGSPCVDTTANTIFAAGVQSFDNFWTAGEPLAPTAANASISGRVTSADGRALGRVRVVITDTEGNVRSALTSAFGYYSVEGLLVGQTYVVSVQSKQHTFTPRTISLGEDAIGFDLIAEP